jgi:hypothetical protein
MKKKDLIDLINSAKGDTIDVVVYDGNDNWDVSDISLDTHPQMSDGYSDELVIHIGGLILNVDTDG